MLQIHPWPLSEFSMRVQPTSSDPRGNGPPPPNHVNTPATPVWMPATIIEIIQTTAPRRVRLSVVSPEPFIVEANEFDPATPVYGTFRVTGPTLLQESFQLDPPSVAAGAQAPLGTWAVPGSNPGDRVSVAYDQDLLGMQLTGYVSAPGVVKTVLRNGTTAAVNLPAGTLNIDVWRKP